MSLTSTHAQYNSLPMRSPTSATIPLDMANYEALPFDRDAISSTNSLAMYGLGASALGSGKGNDPYSVGGKPKANTPPRWTAPSNPNLSSDSSLSSRSHDFIQTPYQASLPHPLPRPIQERAWPSVSVGSDDLAQMGFPMPSPMVGHDSVAQGKKRALPTLPAGVPIQPPPAWEPDTKAHIPPSLINPSIEHAYASLSGPSQPSTSVAAQPVALPADPSVLDPRRPAEHGINLHATAQTPIWSTHYLDPALDDACVLLPPQAPLSANSSKRKRRQSAVVPIGGLWDVPPDGRFVAEDGAVDLTLGVVDGNRAGLPGERTRAKMEVVSRDGEVKVDLLHVAPTRQADLTVHTRSGDIIILLPPSFHGALTTIHPPSHPPTYLPSLLAHISQKASPHSGRSTAFLSSPGHTPVSRPPLGARRHSQRLANAAGSESDSRVNVSTAKGRVIYGIHGDDEMSLARWAGTGGSGVGKEHGRRKRRGFGRLFGYK